MPFCFISKFWKTYIPNESQHATDWNCVTLFCFSRLGMLKSWSHFGSNFPTRSRSRTTIPRNFFSNFYVNISFILRNKRTTCKKKLWYLMPFCWKKKCWILARKPSHKVEVPLKYLAINVQCVSLRCHKKEWCDDWCCFFLFQQWHQATWLVSHTNKAITFF